MAALLATPTADRRLRFPFVPLPGVPAVTDAVAAMDAISSESRGDPISAAAAIIDRELRGEAPSATYVDIPLHGEKPTGVETFFRFHYAPEYCAAARKVVISAMGIMLPPLVAIAMEYDYGAHDMYVRYSCVAPRNTVSLHTTDFDIVSGVILKTDPATNSRIWFMDGRKGVIGEPRVSTKLAFAVIKPSHGTSPLVARFYPHGAIPITKLSVALSGTLLSSPDIYVPLVVDKIQMGEPVPDMPIYTLTFEAPGRDRVAKTLDNFGREDSAMRFWRGDGPYFEFQFGELEAGSRLLLLSYYRAEDSQIGAVRPQ